MKVSPSLTVINYEVTVVTGDVRNGGTNANVFCQLYGEEGKTEVLALKSRSNNFERGTTEIFKVRNAPAPSCAKRDLGLTPPSGKKTDRGSGRREALQDPYLSRWQGHRRWMVPGDGGHQEADDGNGAG